MLKKIKADKKVLVLLGLFLLGLILLVVSSSGGEKRVESGDSDFSSLAREAEKALEDRIKNLLSSVEGVGKVRVMVTLDSLEEYVYAQNVETDKKNQFVIVEDKAGKTGLVKKVYMPKIRGVGITCTGGASVKVRQEIVSLLSSSLGISAAHIYVTAGS